MPIGHEYLQDLNKRAAALTIMYPYSQLTPGTIVRRALRAATRSRLAQMFSKIELDPGDAWRRENFEAGCRELGDDWDYLDNLAVTHAFAELARPRRVLEIGVRRGTCTCAVASAAPDVELHLLDMWIENYGGQANPGPDLVRRQLQAVGHKGTVNIMSGDSHRVLAPWLAQNPQLNFDLILVDGDHSADGALQDLRETFPRLAPGGILVFDDITHPYHPYLLGVWRNIIAELGLAVRSYEYTAQAYGVAFALRVSR